jgi:hypothetical protein
MTPPRFCGYCRGRATPDFAAVSFVSTCFVLRIIGSEIFISPGSTGCFVVFSHPLARNYDNQALNYFKLDINL